MSDISLFKTVHERKPRNFCPVDDFIDHIQKGTYRELVEAVRSKTDKAERTRAKECLPVSTISGTFSEHNEKGLIQHSGFICVDFDAFPDGMDLDTARSLLYVDPFTYAGFLSVGGNGLAILVRIPADASLHRMAYECLSQYYLREYGITTDPAPKNVASFRFISYDPDLYVNREGNTIPVHV